MKISPHLPRLLARRGRASFLMLLLTGIAVINPTGVFGQQLSTSLTVSMVIGTETVSLVSQEGVLPTIPLQAGESRQVNLQFSTDQIGWPLLVTSYDGGEIGDMADVTKVPQGGVVTFSFRSAEVGIYRVLVMIGREQHIMRFEVPSPIELEHP